MHRMTHGDMAMRNVFKNIYAYLTGKVELTEYTKEPMFIDSKMRHIYRIKNGVIIEKIVNPDNNEVLFEGELDDIIR